ncbi:hypothetical protein CL621_04955 [archaeon]|nr:hypothetical protein [archaeon]|tara:strand:- start:106 stop:429 length:324 start_codon:yes stop_codon:yes gene_type:complete
MEKSGVIRTLNKAAIVGLIIVFISFFIPITFCTKSPIIASPKYAPSLCRLPNPFTQQTLGVSTRYYGISTEPLAGAILQFLIATIIFTIVFRFIKKNPKNFIDLTKK